MPTDPDGRAGPPDHADRDHTDPGDRCGPDDQAGPDNRCGPDDRARPDDRGVGDPANRTRLAWTRTAIAFAAIGAALLKSNPVAGATALALTLPIWAAVRRTRRTADAISSASGLRLVTVTVVLVAIAALAVAVFTHGPSALSELQHGR